MIDLIKKAEKWLEDKEIDSITNKQVDEFSRGNLTLNTITNCLIDSEHKEFLKTYFKKHEITDLDMVDLIDSLKEFPDWFFVFVPKDSLHAANILYTYHNEKELSKEIITYVDENYNLLEQISRYMVFNPEIFFTFKQKIKSDNSIEEFFTNIDENIVLLKNLTIENVSIEKMKHFLFQDYIDNSSLFYREIMNIFYENIEKYAKILPKELSKLNKEEASQKLFLKIMPERIMLSGHFLIKKEYIKYSLNESPLDLVNQFFSFYVDNLEESKKKVNKLKRKVLYTGGKIGVSFIPGSGIFTQGKELFDTFDLMKDTIEAAGDVADYKLENVNLNDLLKEFESSDFNLFKDFFIYKTKRSVYNTIKSNLNYEPSISIEVFEDIYKQFFNTYIDQNILEEIDKNFKDQYNEVEDQDLYAIHFLLNQ
jgi:hypothetical protein